MSECNQGIASQLTTDTVLGKDCAGNVVYAGNTFASCGDLGKVGAKADQAVATAKDAKSTADNALTKAQQALDENQLDIINISAGADGAMTATRRNGTVINYQIDTDQVTVENDLANNRIVFRNEDGTEFYLTKATIEQLIGSNFVDTKALEQAISNLKLSASIDAVGNTVTFALSNGNSATITKAQLEHVLDIDLDQATLTLEDNGDIVLTNEDGTSSRISRAELQEKLNHGMATDAELAALKAVVDAINTDQVKQVFVRGGRLVVVNEDASEASVPLSDMVTGLANAGLTTDADLQVLRDLIDAINTDQVQSIAVTGGNVVVTNEDGSTATLSVADLAAALSGTLATKAELEVLRQIFKAVNTDQLQSLEVIGGLLVATNEDGSTASLRITDLIPVLNNGLATDAELAAAIAAINTDQVQSVRVVGKNLVITNEDNSTAVMPIANLIPVLDNGMATDAELAALRKLVNSINTDQVQSVTIVGGNLVVTNEDNSTATLPISALATALSGVLATKAELTALRTLVKNINTDQVQSFKVVGNNLVITNEDNSTATMPLSTLSAALGRTLATKAELAALRRLVNNINTDQVQSIKVVGNNLVVTNEDNSTATMPIANLIPVLNNGLATDAELAAAVAGMSNTVVARHGLTGNGTAARPLDVIFASDEEINTGGAANRYKAVSAQRYQEEVRVKTSNTFVGGSTGEGNTGTVVTAVGWQAARQNTGSGTVGVGNHAVRDNTGQFVVGVGEGTAYGNKGNFTVGIGMQAARGCAADNTTAVGYSAGVANQGRGATVLGSRAGYGSKVDYLTVVGSDTRDSRYLGPWVGITSASGPEMNAPGHGIPVGSVELVTIEGGMPAHNHPVRARSTSVLVSIASQNPISPTRLRRNIHQYAYITLLGAGATSKFENNHTVIGNDNHANIYSTATFHGANFVTVSDRRLKGDIAELRTLANGVKIYQFTMLNNGERMVGWVAQQVEEVLEAAGYAPDVIASVIPRRRDLDWQATLAKFNADTNSTAKTLSEMDLAIDALQQTAASQHNTDDIEALKALFENVGGESRATTPEQKAAYKALSAFSRDNFEVYADDIRSINKDLVRDLI